MRGLLTKQVSCGDIYKITLHSCNVSARLLFINWRSRNQDVSPALLDYARSRMLNAPVEMLSCPRHCPHLPSHCCRGDTKYQIILNTAAALHHRAHSTPDIQILFILSQYRTVLEISFNSPQQLRRSLLSVSLQCGAV